MFRKRVVFSLVFTVFISALNINFAIAGTITSPGASLAYARTTLGQSFTMPAGETGLLTSLTVNGVRGRGPSNVACVRARIYTNSSKSTLLQTSTNTVCDTDSSGGEMGGTPAPGSLEFGNQITLTAGTQYFFELSTTSGATDLWTSQSYVNPGGGYSGGQLFADNAYLANYDISFTLIYSSSDTTAPTFSSSTTFSVAENIATSATAATIKVSESATVTISSGADASLFNISASDSVTAIIKFKASPNYEAPTDVGGNNVYEITLTATDLASNAGTQSITITVTDVVDTSSFNSFALAGSATSATYRAAIQINVSVTVASKVTFKAANIVIPGCKSKLASGSGSTFTVSCSWKPSKRGAVVVSATSVPTSGSISGASASPIRVNVVNRGGSR
jgi:hypothetical protein